MHLRRGLFVVVFLALTVSAVNAYTVVMRDGRRVEIPKEFTVTNSTLTYEVSNGFQVTLQLNTVDIAATERANSEPAGSLLEKTGAPKSVSKTAQTPSSRGFGRFGHFREEPFSGFLATPITPFPTFPAFRGRGRTFRAPGVRINAPRSHMRHGSRR